MLKYRIPQIVTLTPNEIQKRFGKKEGMVDFNKKAFKRSILKAFIYCYVRMIGLEPTRLTAPDPKSGAATNYATSACVAFV